MIRSRCRSWMPLFLLLGLVAAMSPTRGSAESPGEMIGAGNFHLQRDLARVEGQCDVLDAIGAKRARLPVSGNEYASAPDGAPRPERFDDLVLKLHERGIQPMFLFEYYTRHGKPIDAFDWERIGRAFAERFHPNSEWLRSQGVADWGIDCYTAVNEPMWKDNNPTPIPVEDYVAALKALAKGVHSVDASLKVSPGGFQEIPLLRNNPYAPALAPLYNDGTLHAMDIHRYYDVQYQPMYGTYRNSLQNQFDEAKKQFGITRDIAFHTTEFNFKRRVVDEDEAARGFLTAVWDALGVVGNEGQAVTEFVMPWNLFNSPERDEHYGMCLSTNPWKGTLRGEVLQRVCELSDGMAFVRLDPRHSGVFVLEGRGRTLHVWQNREAWTDAPGTSFMLTDLPPGAKSVEVHAYKGLLKTVPLASGAKTATIDDLPTEQTIMFLAR